MSIERFREPVSQIERFYRRWGETLKRQGLGIDVGETFSEIEDARKKEETYSWTPRPSRGIGTIGQSSRRMSHGFRP